MAYSSNTTRCLYAGKNFLGKTFLELTFKKRIKYNKENVLVYDFRRSF